MKTRENYLECQKYWMDESRKAVDADDRVMGMLCLRNLVELSDKWDALHNHNKENDEPWSSIEAPEVKPEQMVLFHTAVENLIKFLTAGNATFTIESEKTQKYYTYKITRKESNEYNKPGEFIYFCSVMSGGADQYSYMAVFDPETFGLRFTAKSKFNMESPAVKAILYFFNGLREGKIQEHLKVYHAGRCGKCGRELTDPESIELGLGPICRQGGLDA